jgi:hypothetical protein
LSPKPVQLVLVPAKSHRLFGWWWTVCGVVALLQLPRAASVVLAILVGVVGLSLLRIGLDMALTRLVVTSHGVRVRGLIPGQAPASDIISVDARATSGLNRGKVRIEIERRNGRTFRLTRLQRYATSAGWSAAHADVQAIRQVLRLDATDRPAF